MGLEILSHNDISSFARKSELETIFFLGMKQKGCVLSFLGFKACLSIDCC